MAFDAHKNFAYSQVATAPSPASSGTSLTVVAGDGAKFPSASFNATVWPANAQPTTTNAEVVRVTVVSTDTFTITRSQESSSARSIVTGDQIAAGITAKTLTDVENQTFNAYKFSVYRNSAQTLSSGAFTKIAFDTKVFDTGTNFDVVTNNRFTAPVAGYYFFTATVSIAPVSGLTRALISLYKNGSDFKRGNDFANGNQIYNLLVSGLVSMAASDFVEIFVDPLTGAAPLGVGSAPYQTFFDGFLVSLT